MVALRPGQLVDLYLDPAKPRMKAVRDVNDHQTSRVSRSCAMCVTIFHRAFSCVFFHAHPDDEALLTAGTMARLAADGHRVVLVVATAGERGLSSAAPATVGCGLGEVRKAELLASARALGCARVEFLGYGDSGLDGQAVPADGPIPFRGVDVDEAAAVLADLLREEDAALLSTYDAAGGYGHPDHVQVHRVGARAAELAGTPLVLQATVDRDLLLRVPAAAAIAVLAAIRPRPLQQCLHTARRDHTSRRRAPV